MKKYLAVLGTTREQFRLARYFLYNYGHLSLVALDRINSSFASYGRDQRFLVPVEEMLLPISNFVKILLRKLEISQMLLHLSTIFEKSLENLLLNSQKCSFQSSFLHDCHKILVRVQKKFWSRSQFRSRSNRKIWSWQDRDHHAHI